MVRARLPPTGRQYSKIAAAVRTGLVVFRAAERRHVEPQAEGAAFNRIQPEPPRLRLGVPRRFAERNATYRRKISVAATNTGSKNGTL